MKLFFETDVQSLCFLMTLPLGFLLMLLLDAACFTGVMRCAVDIFLMLLAGASVLLIIVWNGESILRLYHLLGLLTGAVLYLGGIGKIIRRLFQRMKQKRNYGKDK